MSEQFLATASVRIVPDVTGFATALEAQVTAATRSAKLGPALAANTTATKAFTAATGVSTIAVKENTAAMAKEGATAAVNSAELRLNAKTATDNARAHSQMARGVATATASQFGLRGAVLASSGPFLAAVIAVEAVRKSIDEFTAEQEAAARVTKVFGSAGKELEENAKGMAAGFGLSAAAALKFEGAIGEVFHNVGLANEQSAQFSQRLVKLSADVGAFNNADPSQVLRAFQLGLSGNLRGLRQFVPGITAARVALQAMSDTGKTVKANLTDQELTVARYEVILQAASNQVGTFAQRSGNLAAQSKILQSNIQNLAAEFGKLASPVLLDVVKNANLVFQAFEKLKGLGGVLPGGSLVESILGKAHDLGLFGSLMGPVGAEIGVVRAAVDLLTSSEDKAKSSSDALSLALNGIGPALRGVGDAAAFAAINLNAIRFDIATNAVAGLAEHLTQLDIVGATSAQKIAALQQQAAEAQTAVRTAGTVGERRSARETRRQAIDEIRSIRAADAAAAKSAQSAAEAAAAKAKAAAEAAAREAQAALDAQDAALAFRQQFAEGQLRIAEATAAGTKSLADDIANLRDQLTLTRHEIVEAAAIHDAQTKLNRIQELQLQAVTLQNQIDDQIEAQRQARRQRRLDALDAAVNIASLDAQIAEVRGKPNAEIAALLRENVALEAKRKAWEGNTQKQKEITLAIAQNNQQIKDLRKAQKENAGLSSEAQFAFLTTEAGFVANLLGNLIPRGATAGLVGGTAGAISTPTIARPAVALSAAAQTAGGPRGASTGQMATLIHVQMQMLQAILRLTGQRAHPESTYQRYSAADDLNVATST